MRELQSQGIHPLQYKTHFQLKYTFGGHNTLFFTFADFVLTLTALLEYILTKQTKSCNMRKKQGDKTEEPKLRSELQKSDCN